jgi:peptidoglycan/LPS O-acetylase OafA/YrhL
VRQRTGRTDAAGSGSALAPVSEDAGAAGGIVGPGDARARAEGGHVAALDGVRGLAILVVIVFHALLDFVGEGAFERAMAQVIGAGWVGVDLFFVLSGLLITQILLRTRGTEGYYRRFITRRALRILPLYIFFLVLIVYTLPLVYPPHMELVRGIRREPGWLWTLTSNYMFARNAGDEAFHYGHLWSVAVEEQFYLIWPLFVAALAPHRLRSVIIAGVAIAPILRALAWHWGIEPHAIYVLTGLRYDGLVLGALIALTIRTHGPARTLALARIGGVGGALVIALVILRQNALNSAHRAVFTIGFTAIALVCAWLVAEASQAEPRRRLARLLSSRFLTTFGKYSYSLYLFHIVWVEEAKRREFSPALLPRVFGSTLPAALLYAAIVVGATLLFALLTWRVIERPALARKDRFAP